MKRILLPLFDGRVRKHYKRDRRVRITAMKCSLVLGVVAVGSAYGAACDRACLKTTLDQYLSAVGQHKPAAAPLSIGFRQTENAMVRRPGTGLWESTKGLGK